LGRTACGLRPSGQAEVTDMRNITLLGIAGASTVAIATWMAATMLIVLLRKAAATPVFAQQTGLPCGQSNSRNSAKRPRQTATSESAERIINHACGRHEPPPYPHCGGLDLREVPTLTLERLFAFVVVGRSRRRLLWFAATGPIRHARAIPSVGILPEMRTLLV